MFTALAPPAVPAAPARRQDSSGSSGSYHTAPGSPEPPDVGPDTQGRVNWLWVAPGRGVGAQPLLSVSAQNSRQQYCSGSGFPRGPGSGPPPPPQLRMLPSGEMEVIFSAGPLLSHSNAEDVEAQQLKALQGPVSPVPGPPLPPASDGDSRWATYLELRPRGPSPAVSAQFECVEVALEERAAPVRSRTVPKRQIELRPRPRSPSQTGAPHPRLLLRTGSLDESLGRLQAAAGVVQTALARKLGSTVPTPNNVTFRPTERLAPTAQETARSTRMVLEEARSRPPPAHQSSAPARAPKPWPSLRERAIRRDKPMPGTEQLGPVSSSIFLQSEEKIQEARNQEPTTRCPREALDQNAQRTRSPPVQSRASWVLPSGAVRPRSPSSPWQAPNGAVRGPRCPLPENSSRRDRTAWRVSGSPSFPETSSAWGSRNTAFEEAVSRKSPSPTPLSQWSPPLGALPAWEAPHPMSRDAVGRNRDWSPPASHPRESPDRPTGSRSSSPQEPWSPVARGSPMASMREAMNGLVQLGPPTPSPPGTLEVTEVQSPPTRENAVTAFRGSQPSPEVEAPEPTRSPVVGIRDGSPRPEASGAGEAASGRPRVAIPRPRDVRKMVKTTYAPTFKAGSPGSGPTAPPADSGGEGEDPSKSLELRAAAGPPAPAQYTSVFLKDFLPVVSHPYESSEPSQQTVPRDVPQPSGVPRRRAENSTAKPFARTEIRLPGALALSGRPRGTPEARGRGPSRDDRETREAEAQRAGPDDGVQGSPLGGARTSPQRSPVGPAGTRPPRPGSPPACPTLSPGIAANLETPPAAPEPPTAAPQAPLPRDLRAGRTAAPQPRAASAPPTDRLPSASSLGRRRLPGAAQPGKVLVDPENGRYYFVEAPRQPRLRLLFDPESGQYVEVLLPPSSPGTPRHAYSPLALGPSLYPPAYGPIPGLSLPPSPSLPPLGSLQLPWAPDGGALNGTYYMPMSGTPSPAPPLLFCAPPSSSGPLQPNKGSVFPL